MNSEFPRETRMLFSDILENFDSDCMKTVQSINVPTVKDIEMICPPLYHFLLTSLENKESTEICPPLVCKQDVQDYIRLISPFYAYKDFTSSSLLRFLCSPDLSGFSEATSLFIENIFPPSHYQKSSEREAISMSTERNFFGFFLILKEEEYTKNIIYTFDRLTKTYNISCYSSSYKNGVNIHTDLLDAERYRHMVGVTPLFFDNVDAIWPETSPYMFHTMEIEVASYLLEESFSCVGGNTTVRELDKIQYYGFFMDPRDGIPSSISSLDGVDDGIIFPSKKSRLALDARLPAI